jgi:hypothetical protein
MATIGVGDVVGKWTVYGPPFRNKGSTWVPCRCECGTERAVRSDSLYVGKKEGRGSNGSSQCRRCSQLNKKTIRPKGETGANLLWAKYKIGAAARGLVFTLTLNDMMALTSQNCHYCDQAPDQECVSPKTSEAALAHSRWVYNGVDRKDSSVGYVLENCLPCCKTCNYAKKQQTYDEFLAWILRTAKHVSERLAPTRSL